MTFSRRGRIGRANWVGTMRARRWRAALLTLSLTGTLTAAMCDSGGTGVVATALKREMASEAHVQAAVDSMLQLNRAAAEALDGCQVHGCTDISGFGLLGHGREVAKGSGVTLEIDSSAVPLLPGAMEYARLQAKPGGLKNNREFASPGVECAAGLDADLVDLLYDPQTSGGLLVSLPEAGAALMMERYPAARRIGRVLPESGKAIRVR